jgi:hypothetical protein
MVLTSPARHRSCWPPIMLASLALLVGGCGGGGGGSSTTSGTSDSGTDSPTTAQLPANYPWMVYPVAGQLSVAASQPFQWSAVSGAAYYQLQLGSTRGGNDIFDSGVITSTSVTVPNLPASGVVYARVRAVPQGYSTELPAGDFPRATYATFRTDATLMGAAFTAPAAGATADADTPITWQADPVATGYRLVLDSGSDGTQLLDTGVIHTTFRVVRGLTSGAQVKATLYTYYAQNLSRSQTLAYVVGNAAVTIKGMFALAYAMATEVRQEADIDDQPYDGTPLLTQSLSEGDAYSDCAAFATTLRNEFAYANFPLVTRPRLICYNQPDCHQLVDVYDPDSQRWETVDPTFGLYALNSSGQDATAEEISAAVRAMDFASLSYVFLTPQGDAYAKNYYLDYPLLYMELFTIDSTSSFEQPPPPSYEPYEDLIGAQTSSPVSNFYSLQCASGSSSATANWDGTVETNQCTNGFTQVTWGINVALVAGNSSAAAIWRLHRFVF